MAKELPKLKLGKSASFVKTHLKQLKHGVENNMVWMILIPTLGLAAVGAWLSYSEWAKGTWYLFVAMALLASAMALLWSWAVSVMRENSEIMAFS
jgi:hypothetical protein